MSSDVDVRARGSDEADGPVIDLTSIPEAKRRAFAEAFVRFRPEIASEMLAAINANTAGATAHERLFAAVARPILTQDSVPVVRPVPRKRNPRGSRRARSSSSSRDGPRRRRSDDEEDVTREVAP